MSLNPAKMDTFAEKIDAQEVARLAEVAELAKKKEKKKVKVEVKKKK